MERIDIAGWLGWSLSRKERINIEGPLLWQSPDLPDIENVEAILDALSENKRKASALQKSVKSANAEVWTMRTRGATAILQGDQQLAKGSL
jgi:hypothetical protein